MIDLLEYNILELERQGHKIIKSEFATGLYYDVFDDYLIVSAGKKNGILSICFDNLDEFCEELKEIKNWDKVV